MVKRLATWSALLCATIAAMSGVGVSTARAADTGCLWENAHANPTLWIRQYPSTSAPILFGVSYHGHFYATKYDAYNNGAHWVQLQAGGWANATYLMWLGGYDRSYCE
jgi:hypothetical protein